MVNALASQQSNLGLISSISMSDGLWSPGWTGMFSLNSLVSLHSDTKEALLSVTWRDVFGKLLKLDVSH